jgi:hypothetical protein
VVRHCTFEIVVFWVVASCSLLVVYQYFEVTCCTCLQGSSLFLQNSSKTWHSNPEDHYLNLHCRGNQKSYSTGLLIKRPCVKSQVQSWCKFLSSSKSWRTLEMYIIPDHIYFIIHNKLYVLLSDHNSCNYSAILSVFNLINGFFSLCKVTDDTELRT